MKRLLLIIWAHFRCEFYLMTYGMWRGEAKITMWNNDNRKSFIGASTGSAFDGSLSVTRVFWREP